MADVALDTEMEGLAGLFEADTDKGQGPTVYEVGYHLLPELSADDVTAWVKDLANFLKAEDAALVGEKLPEKIDLAYAIDVRVDGKFKSVTTAHFGWVAFELVPSKARSVKQFMDTNPSVLRYLMVKTSVDEVKAVMEGKVLMPKAAASTETIAAPKRAEEQGGEVTEAELDKALDSLDEK